MSNIWNICFATQRTLEEEQERKMTQFGRVYELEQLVDSLRAQLEDEDRKVNSATLSCDSVHLWSFSAFWLGLSVLVYRVYSPELLPTTRAALAVIAPDRPGSGLGASTCKL